MKKNIFPILLFSILLMSSCRQQKEMTYFRDLGEQPSFIESIDPKVEYRIQPHDILYVKILTLDEEVMTLYNSISMPGGARTGGTYQTFNEQGLYFTGFSVSDSGYVEMPILDKIMVKNLTVEEARNAIKAKANETIKDLDVLVKLASFKVTILGEVRRPGMISYYNNQTTILEALGKAGDLTDYGNRENILIIRPTQNGSQTFRVNLTKMTLIASSEYYIKPNDVIIVEPLKAKGTRLFAQDYGTFISVISTTITAIAIILSFLK
ncbi:polysaccharide biosynthesis/export family protein [Bacteroidota bacterium]